MWTCVNVNCYNKVLTEKKKEILQVNMQENVQIKAYFGIPIGTVKDLMCLTGWTPQPP